MISPIKIVTKREFRAYFTSPIAYVFIITFLVLVGIATFVLGDFFGRGEASLSGTFFYWLPWMYLFLVPAIGMRLWSAEHQNGTAELLLTYPIHPWHALIGKFIAAWAILGLANLLTFPMVLTVMYLGDPDLGAIACGYLGSFLLAGAYLAVTCTCSASSRNQVIAFTVAAMICLCLIISGDPTVTSAIVNMSPTSKWLVDSVMALSAYTKYVEFQKGYFTLSGLLYFFSLIGLSLYLTSVILQLRKR